MKHKAEGYAVYFMILEKLLESSDYMSIKDYNVLAFDFRVGADVVKSVVEDFGLFEFTEDNKYFYSKAFINRMDPLEKIKHRNFMKGVKGNLIRNGHLTKEQISQMTDEQLVEFAENLKNPLKDSLRNEKELLKEHSKEQKNSHKIRQDKIRQDKNIISSDVVEQKSEQIPPPPPNNEISSEDPHVDLVKKILLQQKWIETFRMNLKIPESKNHVAIRRLLHEFLNHLVLESVEHTKEKDFKSHFTAWCRKLDRIRLEEIFLKKSSAATTSKQPNNGSTDYYFLN